ncbi:hypothetical protein GCM10029963_79410 [Micromonospora andamanensis]
MTDVVDSPESRAVVAPMRPESVRLASVVTHPANPRKVMGDLSDLEASIGEVGVIQPPVVLPASRVAAAWPAHAGSSATPSGWCWSAPAAVPPPATSTATTPTLY